VEDVKQAAKYIFYNKMLTLGNDADKLPNF